jgi:hypothetical protein
MHASNQAVEVQHDHQPTARPAVGLEFAGARLSKASSSSALIATRVEGVGIDTYVTRRARGDAAVDWGVDAATRRLAGSRSWDRGRAVAKRGSRLCTLYDWQGDAADGIARILRAAILASNPHDTESWLSKGRGNTRRARPQAAHRGSGRRSARHCSFSIRRRGWGQCSLPWFVRSDGARTVIWLYLGAAVRPMASS